MKRVLPLILVISLLFTFTPTHASNISSEIVNQISRSLSFIEPEKELYGLKNVNFEKIQIGRPINAYEVINGSPNLMTFNFYPLFENENLVALALVNRQENGKTSVQISVELVEQLKKYSNISDSIAMIYDAYGCYIFVNNHFTQIAKSDKTVSYRDSVKQFENSSYFKNSITRSKVVPTTAITRINFYSSSYPVILMDVPMYQQNTTTTSNLCWAYSVASIGNYKTLQNKDAVDIAKGWFGSTNYNRPNSLQNSITALDDEYSISYSEQSWITLNQIYQDLSNDYPLLGVWGIDGQIFNPAQPGHMTVIRGMSYDLNVISLMNPAWPYYGFVNYNDAKETYAYTSSNNGLLYYLVGYGKK